jgi:hypothetical protein
LNLNFSFIEKFHLLFLLFLKNEYLKKSKKKKKPKTENEIHFLLFYL